MRPSGRCWWLLGLLLAVVALLLAAAVILVVIGGQGCEGNCVEPSGDSVATWRLEQAGPVPVRRDGNDGLDGE